MRSELMLDELMDYILLLLC